MTDFLAQMVNTVKDFHGENNFYEIATIEAPLETEDGLFHLETYEFRPGNPAHDCYSVAKSVSIMAVGILYDRRLLKLTDTLGTYLGEFMEPGCKWADLTISDLLMHRTGASYGVDFDMVAINSWEASDILIPLFKIPITGTLGKEFVYSDATYYIVGRIVEKLSSMDLETFLMQNVFKILGIHQNAWSRDNQGHTLGGTGLYLRTQDLAKIGWLYANEGNFHGHIIYSKTWSDIMLGAPLRDDNSYGYSITHTQHSGLFLTGGMYNQGMDFDVKNKKVVAWHATDKNGDYPSLADAFMKYCRG